jgi:hypothetical protein
MECVGDRPHRAIRSRSRDVRARRWRVRQIEDGGSDENESPAAITATLRDAGQGGWGEAATAASAALGAVFFVLATGPHWPLVVERQRNAPIQGLS